MPKAHTKVCTITPVINPVESTIADFAPRAMLSASTYMLSGPGANASMRELIKKLSKVSNFTVRYSEIFKIKFVKLKSLLTKILTL